MEKEWKKLKGWKQYQGAYTCKKNSKEDCFFFFAFFVSHSIQTMRAINRKDESRRASRTVERNRREMMKNLPANPVELSFECMQWSGKIWLEKLVNQMKIAKIEKVKVKKIIIESIILSKFCLNILFYASNIIPNYISIAKPMKLFAEFLWI